MARYKCNFCGNIYDEEKETISFKELRGCPCCHTDVQALAIMIENKDSISATEPVPDDGQPSQGLDYDPELVRSDATERYMSEIHTMAVTGKSIIDAMGIKGVTPTWDEIMVLGAQLNPFPLDEHAKVTIQTTIGKNAKQPMVIENPMFISHMSFGALSKEIKTALSMGSSMAKTAMCSGEGGILPAEKNAAYKYIFEYVPNLYSVTDENLKEADAIEIKIGQGTKPGMGGHLPGDKVTKEISEIRNRPIGKDIISPSGFSTIHSKEDLKSLVDELRQRSCGRPIGIKLAAGKIEKDLEFVIYAKPDFITIDGRGGATGASPKIIRNATSVPSIYILHRAKAYLDQQGVDIDIIMTGGFRVSADVAKAIAMGATAVAVASAALIAAACQQYRICNTGYCPVGIATQDPELRKKLHIEKSAQRVGNYLNVCAEELKTFARITGHENLHDLCVDDLCTISSEISNHTNIPHA